MKKKKFTKQENFVNRTFYRIYIKDNVKYFQLIGDNFMISLPEHDYLSWSLTFYPEYFEMPVEQLLEWNNVSYQLSKMKEGKLSFSEKDVSPERCLEQTNEWILGDGNGSEYRNIGCITSTIPVGYYYGV